MYKRQILTLVFNLIGNVISCYVFGFIGPAISSLVVTLLMAMVQILFSTKVICVKLKFMLPWKEISKYIFETVILGCVFYIIRYGLLDGMVRSISIVVSMGLGGVWAFVYVAFNRKKLVKNWKLLNSTGI